MKEIADILKAYQQAVKSNKRAALATVVSVEGSSYLRPGARMLITDDGQLTGAISGGCLEGEICKGNLVSPASFVAKAQAALVACFLKSIENSGTPR